MINLIRPGCKVLMAVTRSFTLEFWHDADWYVGRLRETPGVFSQGRTLAELEENIRDAYALMLADEESAPAGSQTKDVTIEV